MRPRASNPILPLIVAAASPSMPGSSLEFVAPDGKARRLEPQVDNAGAALHHVADGVRVQRAEATGAIALHSSREQRGPCQHWLKCSSGSHAHALRSQPTPASQGSHDQPGVVAEGDAAGGLGGSGRRRK